MQTCKNFKKMVWMLMFGFTNPATTWHTFTPLQGVDCWNLFVANTLAQIELRILCVHTFHICVAFLHATFCLDFAKRPKSARKRSRSGIPSSHAGGRWAIMTFNEEHHSQWTFGPPILFVQNVSDENILTETSLTDFFQKFFELRRPWQPSSCRELWNTSCFCYFFFWI